MSPEPEQILSALQNGLETASGLIPSAQVKDLEQSLQEAVTARDYSRVAIISQQLATNEGKTALRSDIQQAFRPIRQLVERLGLENTDIKLSIPEIVAVELIKASVATSTIRKDKRRNEDVYVDCAQVVMAKALTLKERGSFVYRKAEDVYKQALQPKRNTKEDIKKAKHYYLSTVYTLTSLVKKIAEKTEAKNIDQVVSNLFTLQKINDQNWIEFYEYIKKEYGELKPQEFIEKVLQRFYTGLEKKESKEKEKKEEQKSKITPSNIKPTHEMRLCAKITTPGVIDQIQAKFLGNQNIEDGLKNYGWKSNKSVTQTLYESMEIMAATRKGKPISTEEDKEAESIIRSALVNMTISKRGWHMIKPEYKAFKLLYSLVESFQGDTAAANSLVDLLFGGINVTIDRHGIITDISVPGAK